MKIIHLVLGKANPNRMNGVNKVVNNLAMTMKQAGKDVEVWGITPTPDDIADLPERPYTTRLFAASPKKWKLDRQLVDAIKSMKNKAVFHLHGGFITEFFLAHRIFKKNKIEYIITPHGCYNAASMENGKQKKYTYYRLFERLMLRRSKALHCLGQSEVNNVVKLSPEVNTVTIPNGQDMSELEFNFKNINQEKAPVFGFVGRMDKKMKGLDLLLDGFAHYKHKMHGDGYLWLIGGSYDIDELKQRAKDLGIEKYVTFWGPKFGEEKLNLISNMDAFYHPSRYEGMPMSILEAAGLGVPCVVSVPTNMAHYIKEDNAGIVLNENTAQEVALSMKDMEVRKYTKQIAQLGQNALAMVENRFNWTTITEQLYKVYAA